MTYLNPRLRKTMFMVQHFSCLYIAIFRCSVLQNLWIEKLHKSVLMQTEIDCTVGCYAFYFYTIKYYGFRDETILFVSRHVIKHCSEQKHFFSILSYLIFF